MILFTRNDLKNTVSGVGEFLGSSIFTVYVNGLPWSVVNCTPECYVDDRKLYVSFVLNDLHSFSHRPNQQRSISCSAKRMQVNIE